MILPSTALQATITRVITLWKRRSRQATAVTCCPFQGSLPAIANGAPSHAASRLLPAVCTCPDIHLPSGGSRREPFKISVIA
jgi:hypothetical protein